MFNNSKTEKIYTEITYKLKLQNYNVNCLNIMYNSKHISFKMY